MNFHEIDAKVRRLAPIKTFYVGVPADKTTWGVQYEDSATEEQVEAVEQFLGSPEVTITQ